MSHQRGASPGDPRPEVIRQYLATTAQRELDDLRAQLDARLAALEAALAQQNGGASLEDLVLELARVATAEAESASTRAAAQAQLAAQERAAAALAEAQRSVEAERAKGERLGHQIEELRTAVDAEHLTAARMKQEAEEARAAVEQERVSSMVLRQEVEQLEQALQTERERLAGIDVDGLRRQIDELQGAVESERNTAGRLNDELAAARRTIDDERHAAEAMRERVAALERAVAQERSRDAGTELSAARRDLEHLRGLLQTERDTVSQLQAELSDAQRVAERRLADDDARRMVIETLERQYAELDARYREALERSAAADARIASLDEPASGSAPPAGSGPEPHAADAELSNKLAAALERIRLLELQLFERNEDPIDLASMLDAKPAPPSALAGQRARRFAFAPKTKVLLDREPAVLVDLSVTGAQVLCGASPDVGRTVTVALLSDEVPSFCQARFLWARREQTGSHGSYVYRAGLVFTDADEAALEAFIAQHSIG